jgi:multidrug resistance efflux pump
LSVGVSSRETLTIPLGFHQAVFSKREIHAEIHVLDKATVAMRQSTREEVKEANETILRRSPLFGKSFVSQTETTKAAVH